MATPLSPVGLAATLRRSMTTRIALSITAVALLLVAGYAVLLDQLVARELRDQNELRLLSGLAVLRDDLVRPALSRADVEELVRLEARYARIQVQLTDATGQILATSADLVLPPATATEFLVAELPPDPDLSALRRLRAAAQPASIEWRSPAGRPYQVLFGRLPPQKTGTGLPSDVRIALALDASKTSEVRRGERGRLLMALLVAAVLAAALGLLIARSVLADTRRFGATAARISAEALDERLRPDQVPYELEDSAQAFNRMLDRLQSSFERLSRFSAEVAHDLRTPIGNLLGEAQVALSRARTAEEYRSVLESAVEEYERISRMIANMLFLARADNAQTVLDRKPIPLELLIRRVVSYFELVAEESRITLRAVVEASATASMVVADESLLTRALGNLVSNALRYAPAGAEVTVSARAAPGGGHDLAVANPGEAIPAAHREQIFERFYRIDPSRDASAGSGLGLAIVRSIADLHGGQVTVVSDDRLTTFTLHLPASR